jgi:hypothetical protein
MRHFETKKTRSNFRASLFHKSIVAVIKIRDFARGIGRNSPATTTQTSDPFPDLSVCPAVWIHVDLGLEFLALILSRQGQN